MKEREKKYEEKVREERDEEGDGGWERNEGRF